MKNVKKKLMIVGNWKMNPDTLKGAKELFSDYKKIAKKNNKVTVLACVPNPFISSLIGKHNVGIGSQDIDHRVSGSFTGSTSAFQVKSVGTEYTLIGHSERRKGGDNNEIINDKVKQAFNANLKVILCVGENERDNHGEYLAFIREQIVSALKGVDKKKVKWITIAYEPVWAIGKDYDKAPTPSLIHEMYIYIKKVMVEVLGKKDGLTIKILYGGSVDLNNAKAIIDDGAIDGLLIGRQSLDNDVFGEIISYANR